MPRPQDREHVATLRQISTSGQPIEPSCIYALIDPYNQAAVKRCRECPERCKGEDCPYRVKESTDGI